MNYLCDTNVISAAMSKQPNLSVRQWLDSRPQIWVSVISVEEIIFGLSAKNAERQRAWFDIFLERRCQLLPVTGAIAYRAGVVRGELRQKGIVRSQADLIIAATAQLNGLTVATRNTRDFLDCGVALLNPFDL